MVTVKDLNGTIIWIGCDECYEWGCCSCGDCCSCACHVKGKTSCTDSVE